MTQDEFNERIVGLMEQMQDNMKMVSDTLESMTQIMRMIVRKIEENSHG